MSLTGLVAPPAASGATAATSLSLTLATMTINHGSTAELSGQLVKKDNGVGLGGRSVTLYQRPDSSSAWSKVRSVSTTTSGAFTFAASPSRSTDFQVRFAGTSRLRTSSSPVRRQHVRAPLGDLARNPTGVWSKCGAGRTSSGVTSSLVAGRTVKVEAAFSRGGTWSSKASAPIAADGSFSARFSLADSSAPGFWRLRIPSSTVFADTRSSVVEMQCADSLTIATTGLPPATQGEPYSASLKAVAGTGALDWFPTRYASGLQALPTGMWLTRQGVLRGTPVDSGAQDVHVSVQDAAHYADRELTLQVTKPSAPRVVDVTLPSPQAGVDYAYRPVVVGGVPPYAWSVTEGALPSGLTLTSDGRVAGTPSSMGESSLTVRVEDAQGSSAQQVLGIAVTPATAWGDEWGDGSNGAFAPTERMITGANMFALRPLSSMQAIDWYPRVGEDGVLYTSRLVDGVGVLHAYDEQTLELLWSRAGPGTSNYCSVASVSGDVVVCESYGALWAVEKEAPHAIRWSLPYDNHDTTESLAVAGNTVVVVRRLSLESTDSEVRALDLADGTTRWTRTVSWPPQDQGAAISVEDNQVYVDDGGDLTAFDLDDGSVRWTTAASSVRSVHAQPGVLAVTIYTSGEYGTVKTLRASDGAVTGTYNTPGYTEVIGPSSADRQRLYLSISDEYPRGSNIFSSTAVVALRLSDASVAWTFRHLDNPVLEGMAVTPDILWLHSGDRTDVRYSTELIALDPATGGEFRRFTAPPDVRRPPVPAHGRVYLDTADGLRIWSLLDEGP